MLFPPILRHFSEGEKLFSCLRPSSGRFLHLTRESDLRIFVKAEGDWQSEGTGAAGGTDQSWRNCLCSSGNTVPLPGIRLDGNVEAVSDQQVWRAQPLPASPSLCRHTSRDCPPILIVIISSLTSPPSEEMASNSRSKRRTLAIYETSNAREDETSASVVTEIRMRGPS